MYGGAGKWEMQKALKEGPEIVVATPGRMIEMIKLKATNMRRCTMMVSEQGTYSSHSRFCFACGGKGGGGPEVWRSLRFQQRRGAEEGVRYCSSFFSQHE